MNKMYRLLALAVLLLGVALPTMAQEEKNYYELSHLYIGVQGGVQTTRPEFKLSDLKNPVGAISFGATFNRYIGMRLNAMGVWDKGITSDGFEFNSNYLTTDIDFLLNVTNLFRSGDNHLLNILLLAGVGGTTEWGGTSDANFYQKAEIERQQYKLASNARLGAQVNLNVSKRWDVNLEAGVNRMNFPLEYDQPCRDKLEAYATAGIAYKFGYKKREVKPAEPVIVPEPVVEKKPEPKPEPKPVVKPAPVVEKKAEPKKIEAKNFNVFFTIAKTNIKNEYDATIAEAVKFAKQNPTTRIYITGYADKGTGNERINKTLSEQRTAEVKKALIDAGIAENRIISDYKGDTEQPFSENDMNRVVIGIVKE